MVRTERFAAIIEREGDLYVVLCPELDVASQGTSIEDARANLFMTNRLISIMIEF